MRHAAATAIDPIVLSTAYAASATESTSIGRLISAPCL